MSHDTEAAFAYAEVADMIEKKAATFFGTIGAGGTWTLSAGREGKSVWPLADGVIQAENSKSSKIANYDRNIAFEYKRPNEGVHGMLTAVGQALAYIDKGYDASVICIPNLYTSHKTPGAHVKQIIETTAPDAPITVYTYLPPNMAAMRPFFGKLICERDIDLSACRKPTRAAGATKISPEFSTVWAHVREGESFPDAFYRYCQGAKIISSVDEDKSQYSILSELKFAVARISPGADPLLYLSSTTGDSMLDKTWRYVWYKFYFTKSLMPIYKSTGPYVINDESTLIKKNATEFQQLFSGRSDSIKKKIIDNLNATPATITLNDAWEMYAKKEHDTAHSYREDIDSGLEQMGMIDSDGMLTDYGYKYVNACEKGLGAYDDVPMSVLRAITLQLGQYDVFLSTIFKYSNDHFNSKGKFYDFTKPKSKTSADLVFDSGPYLDWLNEIFVDDLHMLKTTTLRAGGTRKPFQAELAYLKNLGLIDNKTKSSAFKIGTGLNINWPLVEESISYFNNL